MTTTDKIPILGSKAVIFKNKYDVWQFRMYVKNARRYVEKSLRTKERALAEERAEDLYIEIRNDMKLGKSFFAISIKEGVSLYLEYRKQDIGIADVGIVEGRYRNSVFPSSAWLTAHTVMLQSSGKRERDDTKNKL